MGHMFVKAGNRFPVSIATGLRRARGSSAIKRKDFICRASILSVTDHRRRKNEVRMQWYIRLRLVCHFFVFTAF